MTKLGLYYLQNVENESFNLLGKLIFDSLEHFFTNYFIACMCLNLNNYNYTIIN